MVFLLDQMHFCTVETKSYPLYKEKSKEKTEAVIKEHQFILPNPHFYLLNLIDIDI